MTTNSAVVVSLALLHSRIIGKMDGSLTPHGISFTEFLVMHHLNSAKNGTVKRIELANLTGLSASGVTRLLNPMEKIGLVERDKNPRDRRVSLVRLTEAGERIFADASVSFEHSSDSLLGALEPSEVTEFLGRVEALL